MPSFKGHSAARTSAYSRTDLFCICYSVVYKPSFDNVKNWLKEIGYHLNDYSRILLIGTKTDLREDPVAIDTLQKKGLEPLTYNDGFNLAKEIDAIGYVECSALTGDYLESVFEQIYKFCVQTKIQNIDSISDYQIPHLISRAKSARK